MSQYCSQVISFYFDARFFIDPKQFNRQETAKGNPTSLIFEHLVINHRHNSEVPYALPFLFVIKTQKFLMFLMMLPKIRFTLELE